MPRTLSNTGRKSRLRSAFIEVDKPLYVIAGEVGIHMQTLSVYCNRRSTISHDHMIKLCDYLDCEPEDLIDDD